VNFTFEPVDPAAHAPLLHSWVTQEYARFWDMLDATVSDVAEEHSKIAADPHYEAWLGYDGGVPAFLLECYEPKHTPLACRYEVRPGDVGMHLLVGPPEVPRTGYTAAVFRSVMQFLFDRPATERVVVEPDVRNAKILALNARMGFRQDRVLTLPDKDALLSFCNREQFSQAIEGVRS
jgi:hypothetical protein